MTSMPPTDPPPPETWSGTVEVRLRALALSRRRAGTTGAALDDLLADAPETPEGAAAGVAACAAVLRAAGAVGSERAGAAFYLLRACAARGLAPRTHPGVASLYAATFGAPTWQRIDDQPPPTEWSEVVEAAVDFVLTHPETTADELHGALQVLSLASAEQCLAAALHPAADSAVWTKALELAPLDEHPEVWAGVAGLPAVRQDTLMRQWLRLSTEHEPTLGVGVRARLATDLPPAEFRAEFLAVAAQYPPSAGWMLAHAAPDRLSALTRDDLLPVLRADHAFARRAAQAVLARVAPGAAARRARPAGSAGAPRAP